MIKVMTELERAYMAGIVDGEGSIILKELKAWSKDKSKFWTYYKLEVRIGNTDPSLMEWLTKFGGHIYVAKAKGISRKTLYLWYIGTRDASSLLTQILPYMIIKSKEAKAAILFQSLRKPTSQKSQIDREVDAIVNKSFQSIISPRAYARDTGRRA